PFPAWRLQDPDACAALLAEAGYARVEVETIQVGYHIERSLDWWELVERTPLIAPVESLAPEARTAFEARHQERVARCFGTEPLWLDIPVHMARGVRPEA
ncbi:MAG: hypothetical protein D6721_04410, partial [Gammaproteobacteria bacterium]